MYYLILFLLFFTGCGVHVGTDPVKVEPVTVNHKISFDTDQMYKYFYEDCAKTLVIESEIKKCADDRLNNLMEFVTTLN